jgi:hypothetical protein
LPSRISCWYLCLWMGNLRWMKLLAAVILPTAIVLAIAAFETNIFYPPPSNAPPKGIVWHGHTFAARPEFARWLRSRGIRYGVWARRHPSLVGYATNRRAGRHPSLGYATNRRAHPPAQQAAKAGRARQKGSDWSVERLGGGVAVLASLGLLIVLVRRRRPGSGRGFARQTLQLAARRAVPATGGGAGLVLRGGTATALLSSSMAKSSAKSVRRRGTELTRSLAQRAAPAAKGGARLMLRWATATALVSSSLAASSANTILRRRSEFAWYLATGLLAVGLGLLVTAFS